MSKKEKFIKFINEEIPNFEEIAEQDVLDFWKIFISDNNKTSSGFTENGYKILQYMKENSATYKNLFKAKDIGEGLFISSRSVSGAIRKLVTDGYVEKTPGNPVIYSLTSLGEEIELTK